MLQAKHYPSLVLVQPRKTRPCLSERLLMGRKESNQTKQKTKQVKHTDPPPPWFHMWNIISSHRWEDTPKADMGISQLLPDNLYAAVVIGTLMLKCLRNRSALAVNCCIIIHCLMVSCREDQITSAQHQWFIFVQMTDKQWIITQQFTH